MFTRPMIALLCLLVLQGVTTAEIQSIDGVPHVINDEKPRDGVRELVLTEQWRRGGDDDEDVLLGIVSSVLTDPDGNLYVLDSQLNQILVFGPDGRLLRTLGRQGQGPGEFENSSRITFLPGNDALGVVQTFPGKLVGLNLDGTPAGDIRIGGDPASGGFSALIGAVLGGENLVVSGIEIAFNQADMSMDRLHFVRGYARDGTLKKQYHTKNMHWVFDNNFEFSEAENDYVWWRMAVDHTGRVLIGEPREQYRISVYAPDGALERVFGRRYTTWPRSASLLARFERMMAAQSQQFPPGTRTEVARNEQDIWGINCLPDGSIWVTTSRGMYEPPTGVFTVWDVFDSEGVFIEQVQARVPGKPGTDMMMVTEHGFAIMITGFWEAVLSLMGAGSDDAGEAEAMQIVCYRIES